MDGVFPGDDALISAQQNRQIALTAAADRHAGEYRLPLHGIPQDGKRLVLREQRACTLRKQFISVQIIHHPFLIGAVVPLGGALTAARKLSYAAQSLTVEDLEGKP